MCSKRLSKNIDLTGLSETIAGGFGERACQGSDASSIPGSAGVKTPVGRAKSATEDVIIIHQGDIKSVLVWTTWFAIVTSEPVVNMKGIAKSKYNNNARCLNF